MRARFSMRWMVTLFTGFFLAAALGLALLATLRQVREQWNNESMMHVRTAAALLARTSVDALRHADYPALQQMAVQVAGGDDVERVMVVDHTGAPVADSASLGSTPDLLDRKGSLAQESRTCTDGGCVHALVPVFCRDQVLGAVYVRCSVKEHSALLDAILRRGIEVGLAAILLGCLIAYATAGLISDPLRRLAGSMGEIAEGRLPQGVGEEGCSEMRHMARSFNRMSSVLQRRAAEVGSLADLSLSVSRSLDLATVTRAAIESVEQGLPGARAQIWLPDADREYLVQAGAPLGEDAILIAAHSLLARAFRRREAIAAGGPEAAAPVDSWFAEHYGAGSAIAVPLSAGPDPVGVLVAYRQAGEPPLPVDDVPFLSAAAHQIALAIENARLYGRQERMASVFSRLLLPAPAPAIPDLDMAVRWRPARGGAVAGDYYDFIALPNGRWGIVIGDVCGKGVLAASYTTMAKHVLRSYAYESESPAEILQRTNAVLYAQLSNTGDEPAPIFVTILCALYEPRTGRLVYSHAGHPLGTLARLNSTQPTVLSAGGPPVGVMPDSTYGEQVLYMAPGDTLALYTDGVVEASRSERVLEPERISALLAEHQGQSVEDAADALMQVAARMARGRAADDIALIILRPRGDKPPVDLPEGGIGEAALKAS